MDKDLYEVIGVKAGAKDADIRKAYLKLAKKLHPDVNPGNKQAEQRFKEINLAYEVLKDPKKRAQYDEMRTMGPGAYSRSGRGQGAGGWSGARQGPFDPEMFSDLGLGDLFQEIFGGGGGFAGPGGMGGMGGRRTGGSFRRPGADREANVSVGFQEAARGGERTLEFTDGRRLTVKIPEGVDTGSKIKLAGQGDAGMGGAPSGDLLVTIEVHRHPQFERDGSNVVLRLPITFAEAVLGAEVEVPTLDGKVVMKIPAGVSSGQRLKLGGKGIRSMKSGTRGDQFVELQIKIPKADGEYREIAERLKSHAFKPRE